MALSARPASIVCCGATSHRKGPEFIRPNEAPLGTVISFPVRQGRNCHEQIPEQHGHRLLGDAVIRRQIVVAGTTYIDNDYTDEDLARSDSIQTTKRYPLSPP